MRYILLLLCLGTATFAVGQKITGSVTAADTHEPLVGAAVYWAETNSGAVADENGFFSVEKNHHSNHLVASFVGYQPDTILFSGQKNINFKLAALQMEEVDVHGRRIGSSINRQSALNVTNINAAELCKAACCNLGESFETNASVDVSYTDATTGAKTIQLLGLSGRYVQMLTENVPNMRGIAQAFGLSYIPGAWMDGIQVSKGVGTVVNGFEAVTGQINVEYKKPVGDELASANLFASSSGRYEATANASIHFAGHLSTGLMASAGTDSRTVDDDNDGFRDEPEVRYINLLNRWNYVNDSGYSWQLVAKYIGEERTGGSVKFSGSEPSIDSYGVHIATDRLETWMKNGFSFSEHSSLGIVTSYIFHKQNSFFGQQVYNGKQHSYSANFIFQTGNDLHTLHAGASSQGDFYREDVVFRLLQIDNTGYNDFFGSSFYPLGQRAPFETNYDDISSGIFGQYTLSLEEKLTMIAGLRFDYNNHFGSFLTPRLHVKYSPTEHTALRLGAGRGVRTAALFAENNYLLASSRLWLWHEPFVKEDAWNFGLSATQYIDIASRELMISAEYYRTQFIDQLATEFYDDTQAVRFYAQHRGAYSNTFQIETKFQPASGLEVNAAVRFTDSQQKQKDDQYHRRPLLSRYKGLLTLSYATPLGGWQFDANAQFNGGGTVPVVIDDVPAQYQRSREFKPYQVYNAQITKFFDNWSIYIGAENIGNFTQENPIIAGDRPYSQYFDGTMIWGPLVGRKFYAGVRWSLKHHCEHDHDHEHHDHHDHHEH